MTEMLTGSEVGNTGRFCIEEIERRWRSRRSRLSNQGAGQGEGEGKSESVGEGEVKVSER